MSLLASQVNFSLKLVLLPWQWTEASWTLFVMSNETDRLVSWIFQPRLVTRRVGVGVVATGPEGAARAPAAEARRTRAEENCIFAGVWKANVDLLERVDDGVAGCLLVDVVQFVGEGENIYYCPTRNTSSGGVLCCSSVLATEHNTGRLLPSLSIARPDNVHNVARFISSALNLACLGCPEAG